MKGPLHGVRVLDLTRVLAGPACGRFLADLGADVIKVEPPDGDIARTVRPLENGVSAYFTQANAGKRNVCIDLSKGAEIFARLAERSDVVLENYRPGVLDRLGIGYDALRARNKRLVYCSINGYGSDGPWAERRAYAPLIHAEAGTLEFASRKRSANLMPEVQSHGDVYPALVGANAILAALFERERTRAGTRLDVSMAEVLLYTNEWTAVELSGFDGEQLFGAWNATLCELQSGRWVAFAGNPVFNFAAWARAMSREDLLDDDRFATPKARITHRQEMLDLIRTFVGWFEATDELEKAIEPYGLSAGEVRTVSEIATSVWSVERDVITTIGGFAMPRAPYRSSTSAVGARGRAAGRGEHNREVLNEILDVHDDELGRLELEGVLQKGELP